MKPTRRSRSVLTLVAVCYVYLFAYLPALNNPNENVRLYMTRALVEEGTLAIGRRERTAHGFRDVGNPIEAWGWVNDKALVCDDPAKRPPHCAGTLYAAKAPGTSFLGVPVYAAVRAVGGPSTSKATYLYWLRLVCVSLPTVVFAWVLWGALGAWCPAEGVRLAVVVFYALGTMALTYGQMFAGHQLAALCLAAAFLALHGARTARGAGRTRRFAAAGFFLPAAVLMEYPSALAGLALVAWALWMRPSRRDVVAALLGAIVPVGLLAWFHWSAFGAPWRTPYTTLENPQFVRDIAPGFMGLRGPTWQAFAGSFFAPYNGLFFFAPWMALVVPAAWTWWRARRRGDPLPAGAGVALSVAGLYALFITSHSLWRGGWTLGPRYIVGFGPFAAVAIAAAAARWARRAPRATAIVLGALGAASVAVRVACSTVSQGFPLAFYNPLAEFALPLLRDGYVFENAAHHFLGWSGLPSVLPMWAAATAAVLWAVWKLAPPARRRNERAAVAAAALGGAALVFAALLVPATPWTPRKARTDDWMRHEVWWPADIAPERRAWEALRQIEPERATPGELVARGRLRARRNQPRRALDDYAAVERRCSTVDAAGGAHTDRRERARVEP